MTLLPKVLQTGKTPEEWASVFGERGIKVSPRTIREEARKLAAFCKIGNAMLLKPEHIDRIFEAATCHLNTTNAGTNGGYVAGLMETTSTSTEASELLMKRSQKRKSANSKGKRGNARYLETMRRDLKTS